MEVFLVLDLLLFLSKTEYRLDWSESLHFGVIVTVEKLFVKQSRKNNKAQFLKYHIKKKNN